MGNIGALYSLYSLCRKYKLSRFDSPSFKHVFSIKPTYNEALSGFTKAPTGLNKALKGFVEALKFLEGPQGLY